MREIIWVGVGFDEEQLSDSAYVGEQHRALNDLCDDIGPCTITKYPSDAQIEEYDIPLHKAVDIYDALGWRIGFGIRVASIKEGQEKLQTVQDWLKPWLITKPVSVWAWSPASVPSRIIRRIE